MDGCRLSEKLTHYGIASTTNFIGICILVHILYFCNQDGQPSFYKENSMDLFDAVQLSTKKTSKKTVISWKRVSELMGTGKPEKWESEYRRKYGDRIKENTGPQKQERRDFKKGIELPQSKLISQLSNVRTIDELVNVTGQSRLEVLGSIEELRLTGYDIVQVRTGDSIAYTLNTKVTSSYFEYKHYQDVDKVIRIGIVSDTHMGSIFHQQTYLQMAYDDFQKQGITNVYHAGDISDGHYSNRPGSVYELYAIGFDQQLDDIVKNYPKRDGITTYFITGNHDATHVMNGGANIGRAITNQRNDMVYLGHNYAKVWLTEKLDMDIEHPGDGSSYAYSYKPQKRIDIIQGGQKPKILIIGHYHKWFSMFYRNIWAFLLASFESQSTFMRGKALVSDVGYLILEIHVNKQGDIIECNPRFKPFYVPIEKKHE